ncbi:CrcB-like protein-domain-containing protein [Aspergillus pseudotamarii]|uniref:CrcB-like protein-domain-containing protein n=1 Tax=Aspergillus pseudotamarii TaxID=132259 RepID=A0A5N6SXR2_ASPPS|nr:CrcB-like protein-domain-containing protein [Aspergillus pseudotamarii]KAE8138581.1 CrcB-like protein-domain-containing protein [Aspergillus pseudotamarii]
MNSDGSLQNGRPGPHDGGNLNEVAAPPPVYDPSERSSRLNDYLEYQPERSSQRSPPDTRTEPVRPDDVQSPDEDPQEKHPKPSRILKFLHTTYIVSYLVLFSMIGTLLRVVIECLTFYPGAPVNTSVLWANVGGSMIMGFLSEDQELFHFESFKTSTPGQVKNDPSQRAAHIKAHKKTVPLFIGLTTGFCGSLTSFSTFMRDVYLAISNNPLVPNGPYHEVSLFAPGSASLKSPNGGFSFMSILAVLFTEIGLSLAGLFLGAHIAVSLSQWTPSLPQVWLRKYFDPFSAILAWLSWILVICLVALLPQDHGAATLWSPHSWRGPFLFSLVFAPVGCLSRFYISLKLNSRIIGFPLGTFIVNIVGTMVFGMAYSIQHATVSTSTLTIGGITGCEVLEGIMDGFCGCLTTVSTWILELSDLRRRHAYVYGSVSVAVALCFLVIEIGSLEWTRGLTTPMCFR